MRYPQSQKVLKWLTIIGLPVILLSLLLMYLFANNKANLINRAVLSFSKYRAIAPFIIAQARFESANFTSGIYKKINNPFGMGHPTKRKSLGYKSDTFERGSQYPLQGYRNDTQAFRDFLLYLDAFNFPTAGSLIGQGMSIETYVSLMKRNGYFTGSESVYLAGLKSYL